MSWVVGTMKTAFAAVSIGSREHLAAQERGEKSRSYLFHPVCGRMFSCS